MDITVKTKFDKGDKVIAKIVDDSKKLTVFVLAEVADIKQIVRLGCGFNTITYEVGTYKIGDCYRQNILVEEVDIFSFNDFTKFFEAMR